MLFYTSADVRVILPQVSHVYAAFIDMTENSGSGKIVDKDVVIVQDTLSWGKLADVDMQMDAIGGSSTTSVIPPLLVYPNPFTDYIEISPPGHEVIDITLTDVNGREVLHVEMTCPCRINLRHLAIGVYFYRLETGGLVETGKLVKG